MKDTLTTKYLKEPIPEGVSLFLDLAFKVKGVPITSDRIAAVTLTLYVKEGGAIIGARDHQNVHGTNGGTHGANGSFDFELAPADNVIVGDDIAVGQPEVHVALFEFTYDVSRKGKLQVVFGVENLAKVPT